MKQIVIDTAKREENLYKLHSISQRWIADLTFLNDENNFLQDLINLHFIDLCSFDMLSNTRKLSARVSAAIKKNNLLIIQIQTHEKQLATLFESDHFKGESDFRVAQKKLANRFDQHVQSNRLLKNRIFTIIKDIMRQQKRKKLLSPIEPLIKNTPKE